MDTALAAEMKARSEELARTATGLDHSIVSLHVLDALAASTSEEAVSTQVLGAYLGEVIRRVAPEEIAWAREDSTPVLVVGSARWHPLEKVDQRRRFGPGDDLAAFAAVVLARTPGAAERMADVADWKHIEEARARVAKAAEALRADPSDPLRVYALERALFGSLPHRHHADALRRVGLRVEELVGYLGAPPVGRGCERRDPGDDAARLIAHLVELGLAPADEVVARLEPRLKERDKTLRAHVAYVLTRIDFHAGSSSVAEELASTEDRACHEGVVRAMGTLAWQVRDDEEPAVAFETLVPLLLPWLAPSSPHVSNALDVVSEFTSRPEDRALVRLVLPAIEELTKSGKATVIRRANDLRARARAAPAAPRSRAPTRSFRSLAFVTVDGSASYAVGNAKRLSLLRELMREVGAMTEPGVERALGDGPALHADAASAATFRHFLEQRITPAECRAIAERLREHLDVVREVATFFDDAPRGSELLAWVNAWADFNALAAERGGYRFA